jgi:hypothetical protein
MLSGLKESGSSGIKRRTQRSETCSEEPNVSHREKKLEMMIEFLVAVRKITKSDYWLRHVCPSAWNNSAPSGRISMKFGV